MPFKLGPIEVILILVIIFIIFGAGRLPQLFELVGRGVRGFRRGKKGGDEAAAATKSRRKVAR